MKMKALSLVLVVCFLLFSIVSISGLASARNMAISPDNADFGKHNPITLNMGWSSIIDCTSGPDCSAKLNGDYEVVRLINDINDCSENCIVFSANNVVFDGNDYVIDGTGLGNGIKLNGYSGVTVQNSEVKEFDIGIDATNSNSATIIDNHVHHNHAGGIWLQSGDNNLVKDNTVEWTNMEGIGIALSNHNTIENNVIQINFNNGIWIFGSDQNTINDNVIFGNGDSNGDRGINIISGSFNELFHNNLKSNFYNAADLGSNNAWNSAYPVGGNYWTDYDQESEGCYDYYSGPNQDLAGSDGFCDSPYPNGVPDNYPFYAEPTAVELKHFKAKSYQRRMVLSWETGSEIDNAGFHIWKSSRPNTDANYIKITDKLIPSKGGPTYGAEYFFTDKNAFKHLNYYYKLESVDYSGKSVFTRGLLSKWK